MKKKFLTFVLVMALISAALASTENTTPNKSGGGTFRKVLTSSDNINYTNNKLGFSLTLPASWKGLYRVEENPNGVSFINIRNDNAGYGGFLFGIYVSDNTESSDWGYNELAVSAGKHYYASTPTDVQFVYKNKQLTDEYKAMEKDISSILKTFRLEQK